MGFGFRVSCVGFRVSGVRVSGFEFQVSGFGFRVQVFGFRVSGFEFRVSGFEFRVSVFGTPQTLGVVAHRGCSRADRPYRPTAVIETLSHYYNTTLYVGKCGHKNPVTTS